LDISSATVLSEPTLYRLLAFHIPNLVSIFLSLGHLSKESIQVCDSLWHFITSSFFLWWGGVSRMPNTKSGGLPLVGPLLLLIQYIHSCPLYLKAVSSIFTLRAPCCGDKGPT
jgi:hypothetical protein